MQADGLEFGTMPPLSPEKLIKVLINFIEDALALSVSSLKLYVRDEKEPLHFLYALELLDTANPVCVFFFWE